MWTRVGPTASVLSCPMISTYLRANKYLWDNKQMEEWMTLCPGMDLSKETPAYSQKNRTHVWRKSWTGGKKTGLRIDDIE